MTIEGVPHNKPWFSLVSSGVDITGNLHTSKGKAMVSGRFSNSSDLESRPWPRWFTPCPSSAAGTGSQRETDGLMARMDISPAKIRGVMDRTDITNKMGIKLITLW